MRVTTALILGFLIYAFFGQFLLVADASPKKPGLRPIKAAMGFVNYADLYCHCATDCQKAAPGTRQDYRKFMDEANKNFSEAKASDRCAEELQKMVLDFRDGLAAREKVYGRCPGQCGSYNFPELYRIAARQVMGKRHLDFIVDVQSIWYGADVVLLNGLDVMDETVDKLEKERRKPGW